MLVRTKPLVGLLPLFGLLAACVSERPATVANINPPPQETPLPGTLGSPDTAPASSSGSTVRPPGTPSGTPLRMSAAEVSRTLANNTVQGMTSTGLPYTIYFLSNGQERLKEADFVDTGTWRVLPDGRFCSSLSQLGRSVEECYVMYRNGNVITYEGPNGVQYGTVTVVPGNPQSL